MHTYRHAWQFFSLKHAQCLGQHTKSPNNHWRKRTSRLDYAWLLIFSAGHVEMDLSFCLEVFALFFLCASLSRLSPSRSLSFSYHCQILYLFWHSPINVNCSSGMVTLPVNCHILAPALQCVCVCVCVCVCAERTVDRWCRTAGPEWQVCVTWASTVVKERKTTLTERNYLKRNSLRLPGAGKQRGVGGGGSEVQGGHSGNILNRFGAREREKEVE